MATSHSDTAFVTIEKSFTYRGGREHWSNAYHFDQVPPTTTAWQQLAGDLWNYEKVFLPADVQWEWSYGHEPGTPPVLVWEADEPPAGEGGVAGSFVPGAGEHQAPGDAAMWIRYGTTQKSKLGKPIYLRNYYHAVYTWSSIDDVTTTQLAFLNNMGTALVNGLVVSGVTYRRAGPRGAVAQNHLVGTHVTTRTLKHRGRRHRLGVNNPPPGYSWKLTPLPDLTIN